MTTFLLNLVFIWRQMRLSLEEMETESLARKAVDLVCYSF